MSIGFGVAPAPRCRARAAARFASISRSDGEAAIAASTTERGSFQSMAADALAAIRRAPAMQAKRFRNMIPHLLGVLRENERVRIRRGESTRSTAGVATRAAAMCRRTVARRAEEQAAPAQS